MSHYCEGQHEDSRSKRQQILAAAYDVFSRKGYHRATVDEIIELADTGKGTVYNYFTNKEQLFYTLIQERSAPFQKAMDQVAASDRPCLAKIEGMVRLSLKFYVDNADLWRVLMHEMRGFGSEGHSSIKPEMRERYRNGFYRIIHAMEAVLTEGVAQGLLRNLDVTKSAYALFSVIVTMVYQNFVGQDLDETAHQVTDIFLHGTSAR